MTERAKKLLLLYCKQGGKIRRVSGLPLLTFKAKKAGTLKNYRIYGNTETKTRSYSGAAPLSFLIEDGAVSNYRIYGNTENKTQSYSGSAPLSFPITDGAVSNYRVYGNTVNGESVGDRTGNLFDSESITYKKSLGTDGTGYTATSSNISNYIQILSDNCVLSYNYTALSSSTARKICFYNSDKKSIGYMTYTPVELSTLISLPENCKYIRLTLDENIYDVMLNSGSTALPYEPYGYKVPVTVEGKNLLPNNGTSYASNVITATKNDDGSVTVSNRGEERTLITWAYYNSEDVLFKAGTQICISTRHTDGISFKYSDNTYSGPISQQNVYTIPKDVIMAYSQFYINANEIHTLYPMIRKADIEDDTYEPYHAPVTTPIYLPEQIKMVGDEAEYIDYAEQKLHRVGADDIDVTLPALPVLPGTNTLTVGTEVQPSSVAVDVSEFVSCGDKVTDSQSVNYGKYAIPITNNSETANIYLDEPLREVGNEADYVDYATQKWYRVRKNLFDEQYESIDDNNPDELVIYKQLKVGDGAFTLSTTAPRSTSNYCNLFISPGAVNSGVTTDKDGVSNGASRTVTSIDGYVTIGYRYFANVNPKLYQTQLERGNTATYYEPYIENTEVDVTIPDLPAQSSTNSLSVGTVVQPSSVAVDVNEVVSCGDRTTENLFDGTFIHRSVIETTVCNDNPNRRSIVVDISNFNNGDKITFSRETGVGSVFQMYQVTSPLEGGRLLSSNVISGDSNTLLATITLDNISNYHYLMIFLNGATNIITDEELLASKIMVNVGNTPLPYEPFGYKVPVTVGGKNLINSSIYEIRNTGVEYTVNNDKSITANGSTSSSFSLFLVKVYLTKGSYIISGCPQNGSHNTYRCEIRDMVLTSLTQDTGAGVTYGIVTDGYYYYSIRIAQNYVCNNLTFYPMIRKADIEDGTYEPYHAPVTTPIYLPEPIKMVGDEAEYVDYATQKWHRVRKNLFDENGEVTDIYIKNDGTTGIGSSGDRFIWNRINVIPNTEYTVSWQQMVLGTGNNTPYIRVAQYDSNGNFLSRVLIAANEKPNNRYVWAVGNDVSLVDIRIDDASSTRGQHLEGIMLNAGSDALPYEPYIENTEVDVILPGIAVTAGINTLTVGTEVQPSSVEIKGKIKAAGGD